jgi:hypothetical protein
MSCSVVCIRLHSDVVCSNGVQFDMKKMPLHVPNILTDLEVWKNFRHVFKEKYVSFDMKNTVMLKDL